MPIHYGSVRGMIYRAQQTTEKGEQNSASRHTGGRKAVVLDGVLRFSSIKECAEYIKCTPDTLSSALRDRRGCRGHEVKYEGGAR